MFSTVQPPPHLQLLHSRGVDLVRAAIIGDDKREIVEEVLRLRDKVGPDGFVFTSGGIGPTHDDITYESVAGAGGAADSWGLAGGRGEQKIPGGKRWARHGGPLTAQPTFQALNCAQAMACRCTRCVQCRTCLLRVSAARLLPLCPLQPPLAPTWSCTSPRSIACRSTTTSAELS